MGTVISPLGGGNSRRNSSALVEGSASFHITKLHQKDLGRSWLDHGSWLDRAPHISSDSPEPGIGTLAIEEMLQPVSLLSHAIFSVAGEREIAGRRAIEVSATPRRQWHEYSGSRLWEGPDEFLLLVDEERGVLLGVTSVFQGQAFAGKEFEDVTFGEPLPFREDRWEAVAKVISLLYSAQHNFSTVRATVREWLLGNEKRSRIIAAIPSKLRTETIADDGQIMDLRIYNGSLWWRHSLSRQIIRTNAPISSFPAGANIQIDPHPLDSGDMKYQVMDAEYGISANLFLNPSPFIYAWWLEPTGRTEFAGREVIRVQGSPNYNNGHRHWWEKVRNCELLVDAERGTLLRLAGSVGDENYAGHEVSEVEYDEPIDEGAFQFIPPLGSRITVKSRLD